MKPSIVLSVVAGVSLIALHGTNAHAQVSFPGPELLGRPTDHSVTLNVVANTALEAYVEYGTSTGIYPRSTPSVVAAANEPIVIVISALAANTRYYYRLRYRISGSGDLFSARDEHTFHTQRPPGSSFTFTIVSDSHVNILLGNPALYQQTLVNVGNDNPDFHMDLGDTFAMDNVTASQGARDAYLFQRSPTYMGRISHSVPVFLCPGNHEQEEGWHLDDNGNPVNSQPVWGTNARKRYFLNPVPDEFYSGNTDTFYAIDGDQLHEDYYSWTWGDALFVVIDPFWYTTTKPFTGGMGGGEGTDPGSGDRWDWTLGQTQYNWLKQTLESTTATFKFVFAHHMVGGTQDYVRGGAYGAPYCEWGGRNEDGTTWGFGTRRPGWYAPVHQLLVENGVSAFFHGHDHEYAYEIRDGIVYQEVPMPSDINYGYGFGLYSESNPMTIKVLPNSGHLRVTVSSSQATVEYVRSYTSGGSNGEVAYSYVMNPTPVPIQLAWFTARHEPGRGVSLEWMTISEVNNYGFFVERKRHGEDHFSQLPGSFIPGQGTTLQPHRYSYVDLTSDTDACSYRLKQIDLDGTVHYLDPVQVGCATEVTEEGPSLCSLAQNSPNPFNADTEIRFSVATTGRANLEVYNILGRLVATLFNDIAEAGRLYKVRFNSVDNVAACRASGVYFYRLTAGGSVETKRFVLLR